MGWELADKAVAANLTRTTKYIRKSRYFKAQNNKLNIANKVLL